MAHGVAAAFPNLAFRPCRSRRSQPGRDYFYRSVLRGEGKPGSTLPHAPRLTKCSASSASRSRRLRIRRRLLHRLSGHGAERSGCRATPPWLHLRICPLTRTTATCGSPFPSEARARSHTYRMRHTLYKLDPVCSRPPEIPVPRHLGRSQGRKRLLALPPSQLSPLRSSRAKRPRRLSGVLRRLPIRLNFCAETQRGLPIVVAAVRPARRVFDARRSPVSHQRAPSRRMREALRRAAEPAALPCSGPGRSSRSSRASLSRGRVEHRRQQLLIAGLEHANIAENLCSNDAWDGYPRTHNDCWRLSFTPI